ncbi:hypothetical protein QAD02_002921 [Eretmocerus hayati]|uniref:Uncharacterized protein n=1 Tax=Eretmocerus hayati TaxID=131215 RepID=A0ACC2NKP1_9HYME|nr:hypothetical protein QAD02_002921 [Eretmocerus hayati]
MHHSDPFHQLHGGLAVLKQKKDESVISFSIRVEQIAQEIPEKATRENRITQNFEKDLERDKIKFFLRRWHWVIKARMEEAESLEDATTQAIGIERGFNLFELDEIFETIEVSKDAKIPQPLETAVRFVEAQKT